MKNRLPVYGLLACLLSTASLAGPVTTINGVTIPTDFNPSGSNQLTAGIVGANLITTIGETLTAEGIVTAITDASNNIIWSNGQNNISLVFTVTNFLATSVVAPTSVTAGSILFSGGNVNFYTLPTTFSMGGHGSPAADVAAIQLAGTLWLSEKGVSEDAGGDTLIASLPINSTLTNFQNGTVAGYANVTGGAAAANFATASFANAFAPGGTSDTSESATFNTGASGDFQLSGTAFMKADTIPEPREVGLMLLFLGVMFIMAIKRLTIMIRRA